MSDQKKDLMDIAVQAEQDLNSDRLKGGAGQGFGKKDTHGASTSSMCSDCCSYRSAPLSSFVADAATNILHSSR